MRFVIYEFVHVIFLGKSFNDFILMFVNALFEISRYTGVKNVVVYIGHYINAVSFRRLLRHFVPRNDNG